MGEVASSTHDGIEATGAMQASYRMDVAGVTVAPAAGLEYVHLFENGFDESGAPGFTVTASSRNANSLRPFIGASAARSFITGNGLIIIPHADLAWSHELFSAARHRTSGWRQLHR